MDGTRGMRDGGPAGPGELQAPLTDLAFNILVALEGQPLHGYALIKELRGRTGRSRLRTGTVYAALARLTADRWVEEVDPPAAGPEADGRRRYYGLTEAGRMAAAREARRLRELLDWARTKNLAPGGP